MPTYRMDRPICPPTAGKNRETAYKASEMAISRFGVYMMRILSFGIFQVAIVAGYLKAF